MMPEQPTTRHPKLGAILLMQGLISPKRLKECLGSQDKGRAHSQLGRLLLRKGIITESQLHDALAQQGVVGSAGVSWPRILAACLFAACCLGGAFFLVSGGGSRSAATASTSMHAQDGGLVGLDGAK